MVDSIVSGKISPIAHKRTIPEGSKEKSKRNRKQAPKKSQEEEQENNRVGGNVDERC